MEFVNHTPFDAVAFEGLTPEGRAFHVVAAKQTLAFDAAGTVRLCDEQAPLLVEDRFAGEPNRSSVVAESDFCPFKPRCDVTLVGDAHAPGGVPVPRIPVRLRVQRPPDPADGDDPPWGEVLVNKVLVVTGERSFVRTADGGWTLLEPLPCDRVPLGYELAQGGENRAVDPETGETRLHEADPRNPIGRGFANPAWIEAEDVDTVAAPRIETFEAPLAGRDDDPGPLGFGAIAKAWAPRRDRLGTVDDAFVAGDAPLPADFSPAYWNAAPQDQQVDDLVGDEILTLDNLTPEGHVRIALPGDTLFLLLRGEDGDLRAPSLELDTVLVDARERRVHLTWRLAVHKDADAPVRVAELRYRDRKADRALRAQVERALGPFLDTAHGTAAIEPWPIHEAPRA
jgi:hypothetical protein